MWAANKLKNHSQSTMRRTSPGTHAAELQAWRSSRAARSRDEEKKPRVRSPTAIEHEERLKYLDHQLNKIKLDDHIKYNRERREAKVSLQQFRSQAAQELLALIKKQKEELEQQL